MKNFTTEHLLNTPVRKYARKEKFMEACGKAGNACNVLTCGKHYAVLANDAQDAESKMRAYAQHVGLVIRKMGVRETVTTTGKKSVGTHIVCIAILDAPQPQGTPETRTQADAQEQPVPAPRKATKKSMRADIRKHLEDALALAIECEDEATIAALTVALKVAHK